jgi:hypothetical protein
MKKIIALAVAAVVAAPAMADLTISGNIETNTKAGDSYDSYDQSGRVQLGVSGSTTMDNGMYISAAANINSALGSADAASVATDGVSLTIGNEVGSIALGAREAEIWANGGDIIANGSSTSVAGYTGTAQRAHDDNNIVLTANLAAATVQAMVRPDANGDLDTRLTVSADLGVVALGAAVETDGGDSDAAQGYVVNVSGTAGDIAYGVSYAKADDDDKSVAVYGTVMGLNVGWQNNEEANGDDEDITFVAYPIAGFAGIDGATVTLGASTSSSSASDEVDATDFNIRVNYTF